MRLDRLELPEGVEHRDYVPEDELWSLMAACDAIVSLRSPTMGETSGSAIRALSLGKPLVVSDVGWFAELPADAVIKVPVDEARRRRCSPRSRRSPTRLSGRRWASARESWSSASTGSIASPRPTPPRWRPSPAARVQERVLHEVASAAAEVGMDGDDAAVLAARLREVGLGD